MLNYFKRERMAKFAKAVQNFFLSYFKRAEIEEDKASKLETYMSFVYKLLVWEDPFLSGVALFLAHVLFWIVIQFELRLYGIIFISLIILFVFDAIFDGVISQTGKTLPVKNIRDTVKLCIAFLQYLSSLRRDNPGTFCVSMCTAFLLLNIIGRSLSGLFLSYFGLISFILIPGIIYRLPPEIFDTFRQTLHIISTDEGVVDERELLPANQDDVLEERDDDCDSLKTNQTADSCTNSFISGVTSMPSYLDAEGSLDGLDEEDLEFTAKSIPLPSTYSTDSDSDHKDIKFEASYFNRDSSSDEERNYERGLTFSELDTADKPTKKSQLSTDLLSSLVSTVLKTVAVSPKRSDSDSDFEIIDSEEIKGDQT